MTLVALSGEGWWVPTMFLGHASNNLMTISDVLLLDADAEEIQLISRIRTEGGGAKTFGTSGSALDWLPGASITFASGSTLRVGAKKASRIDTANGPVARATLGAAAFDVYKDLVGGTDTITSVTARSEAMASGTPFTVNNGDLIALCFHLETTSGTPSVKVRCGTGVSIAFLPAYTLVTAGPTYTGNALLSNVVVTFDDGSQGWLAPTLAFSASDVSGGTIGNTNIQANILQFPLGVEIDALGALVSTNTNAGNFSLDLYSTPLDTPTLVEGIACDANIQGGSVGNNRLIQVPFATPRLLSANTAYAIGVRQTTATAVSTMQRDVFATYHWKPHGLGAECYGAVSTAGATFAAQNSGKRRYHIWARVSAIDIPAGGGGTPRRDYPYGTARRQRASYAA